MYNFCCTGSEMAQWQIVRSTIISVRTQLYLCRFLCPPSVSLLFIRELEQVGWVMLIVVLMKADPAATEKMLRNFFLKMFYCNHIIYFSLRRFVITGQIKKWLYMILGFRRMEVTISRNYAMLNIANLIFQYIHHMLCDWRNTVGSHSLSL